MDKSLCDRTVIDAPHCVLNTIFGSEIVEGLLLYCLCQQPVDLLHWPMCQKDGATLDVAGIDVADAVIFLLGTGVLVTLDHTVEIIVDRRTGNYTGLRVSVLL